MKNQSAIGHMTALFTIIVWGTTFISTKVLLQDFEPVEILFFRFLIGLFALFIFYPHRLRNTSKKQEITFALAGLTGVCMYYLLENIALTYTLASNVGIIISIAPFFTALLSHFFGNGEDRLHRNFFLGFFFAIVGIFLISFQGSQVQLNPIGDLLSFLAAFVWACYSLLTKKIGTFQIPTVQATRRIFTYGTLFIIPFLFFFDFKLELQRFLHPVYLGNIIFLGFCASAICFATWNFAVKVLGPVKTSVYIYITPVVTVITSVLVLHEPMTIRTAIGILLTLSGLLLSEKKA